MAGIVEIAAHLVGEALGMAWENSGDNDGVSYGHSVFVSFKNYTGGPLAVDAYSSDGADWDASVAGSAGGTPPADMGPNGQCLAVALCRAFNLTIYSTIYYMKPEDRDKGNAVYKIDFDNKTAGIGCSLSVGIEHGHEQEGYRYSIVRHSEGWEAFYTVIFVKVDGQGNIIKPPGL
ncbi:hypothetical protein P171DRAFT_258191 [Karstenula rhodostoma CBS 690.94]|uniref:Uncharacterized protein n=1 Tax=Karstenula rhodostoma CBS 690.94 TaxID=1392251 RepID=A0A9P4PLT0_9PLEO|nr:hypothetical protein P171DRAFT_258191 [Karstenula rhodostoma CBS 690.94]